MKITRRIFYSSLLPHWLIREHEKFLGVFGHGSNADDNHEDNDND